LARWAVVIWVSVTVTYSNQAEGMKILQMTAQGMTIAAKPMA